MSYFTPKTWMIMLLGVLGALIGVVIFFWGPPATLESQAFITSPEFVVWFLINEALFAFYPILFVMI